MRARAQLRRHRRRQQLAAKAVAEKHSKLTHYEHMSDCASVPACAVCNRRKRARAFGVCSTVCYFACTLLYCEQLTTSSLVVALRRAVPGQYVCIRMIWCRYNTHTFYLLFTVFVRRRRRALAFAICLVAAAPPHHRQHKYARLRCTEGPKCEHAYWV